MRNVLGMENFSMVVSKRRIVATAQMRPKIIERIQTIARRIVILGLSPGFGELKEILIDAQSTVKRCPIVG